MLYYYDYGLTCRLPLPCHMAQPCVRGTINSTAKQNISQHAVWLEQRRLLASFFDTSHEDAGDRGGAPPVATAAT